MIAGPKIYIICNATTKRCVIHRCAYQLRNLDSTWGRSLENETRITESMGGQAVSDRDDEDRPLSPNFVHQVSSQERAKGSA